MSGRPEHLDEPVATYARTDQVTLREQSTIRGSLEDIRRRGIGERIVYLYVVDTDDRLTGVLPVRRLLTADGEARLADLMIRDVVTLPYTATILDACEAFVQHKLLAFPIVDDSRRVVGVVDVSLFSEEVLDVAEREQTDAVFEAIGFRVSQLRDASPARAFRFRFPWLVATLCSGTVCALLASIFEATIAASLVLAFFLTLVLGLGESVGIQSMTVTIQALRVTRPTFRWYLRAFAREVGTALLLGTACGVLVGLTVWIWRGAGLVALAIGSSLVLALCTACLLGLSVPAVLHALRLDLKVAAGPLTLALTDICTLTFYFVLAAALL